MTEEVKVPEGTQEQTPEAAPAPFEAKALEMGWRPKEEWDGPEEEFIDAKEFVRRQPLFEKIESQSKSIKQLAQAFEALKTHHTKVKETEYQRALASLKAAKREALRDGETDRALAYEEKIDEVEQQKAEFDAEAQKVQVPQEAQAHPEFVAWKQKNNWYSRDQELREFADSYGTTLARKGMQPAEVLDAVAKQIRKAFPEKFTNPNRERAGSVEAPTRSGASQTGFSMSEDERTIMKKIVRAGGITEAEYVKELKRVKGL
jgi:hypothetical protein